MGLDMYLNKMPRYRGTTARKVSIIESYLDWISDEEYKSKYTLKEWCGVSENEIPGKEVIEFYKQYYKEGKYGYYHIFEQVGYWRKANQIHDWFVENVQDGEDDCRYHHEVTKDLLEELLDICTKVFEHCELTDGIVKEYDDNGELIDTYEEPKTLIDSSVAQELLPTSPGFFFGTYDYDEWYVQDIKDTIDIITQVLETTDFDKEAIYYRSSW